MTSHYVDITVLPDPETSGAQLLGVLYERFHQALVQSRVDTIGVSFPQYSINPRALGNVLRLHGDAAVLRRFMEVDWLKGVKDHVRMTEIAPAPTGAVHRVVQRRQFKTNVERMRRRRMRRKKETMEQATRAIPDTVQRRPNLPYVHMRSQSSKQPFCLFVDLGPATDQATSGTFNSYGLGGTATVPWF